jgi:hypothetical protein
MLKFLRNLFGFRKKIWVSIVPTAPMGFAYYCHTNRDVAVNWARSTSYTGEYVIMETRKGFKVTNATVDGE